MRVSGLAAALLPLLIILYPLLLLLDDLEPGFVRSVVNPHWFLVALIVVGMMAGHAVVPATREDAGHTRSRLIAIACIAAAVVGLWVWWRLHAGMLGIVVALFSAIAVFTAAFMLDESETLS